MTKLNFEVDRSTSQGWVTKKKCLNLIIPWSTTKSIIIKWKKHITTRNLPRNQKSAAHQKSQSGNQRAGTETKANPEGAAVFPSRAWSIYTISIYIQLQYATHTIEVGFMKESPKKSICLQV